MLRFQAARISQTGPKSVARTSRRAYATVPPPPSGQPAPQPKNFEKKSDNTLLYVGLGLAGAAGAYYYLKETDEPAALEKQARRDQERVKVNARQTVDATKDVANDHLAIGRAKADQVKDDAKGTLQAGRSKAEDLKYQAKRELDTVRGAVRNATTDGIEEGRGLFDKAEDSVLRTKEQTEATFRNTRDSAEQKAADLRSGAEKKGEEVKEGWFSWLGYGKSKVADAEQLARERRNQLEAEADRVKREAARGVANTAEDVRVRAEKHT